MTGHSDETQEVERAHIEKPEDRPTLLGRYLARMHRSLGRSKGARDGAIAIGGVVLSSAASPLGIIAAGLQLFAMGASADDLDAIDARVAQLETDRQSDEAAGPTRRVRGPALTLLIYALDRALSSWVAGDAEEEEASGIGLTPREFGDGGRELEYLGLVDVDLSASSAPSESTRWPRTYRLDVSSASAKTARKELMLYLISYNLREAVPDHDYLNSRLEEMGAIRVLPSQWLLVSDLDVRAILNLVVESGTMNRTDGLFIVRLRREAYWDALLIDNPSVQRLFQEAY